MSAIDHARALGLTFDKKQKIALCPGHDDTKPSLQFYDDSGVGLCKCFVCNFQGSAIDLHAKVKKIDPKQAVRDLAEMYGISSNAKQRVAAKKSTPSKPESDPKPLQEGSKAESKPEPKDAPPKKDFSGLYEDFLAIAGHPDDTCMAYLTGSRRCLDVNTVRRLRFAQVKSYRETMSALQDKHPIDDLKAAGLYNDNDRLVFYKNTLIVPYLGMDGKPDYLRGRYFWDGSPDPTEKDVPKMIGLAGRTPPLYNTATIKTMNEGQELYIVEGEFDAACMESHGYRAIAVPGMNNWPSKSARGFADFRIIILLDNPKPGKDRTAARSELKGIHGAIDKIAWDFHAIGKPVQVRHIPLDVKDITDLFAQAREVQDSPQQKGDAYEG